MYQHTELIGDQKTKRKRFFYFFVFLKILKKLKENNVKKLSVFGVRKKGGTQNFPKFWKL